MKNQAIALFFCIILAGCDTCPKKTEQSERIPPAEAMRPCKPLSDFEGDSAADLVEKAGAWAKEHNIDCARPHQELIDWVKAGQKKP